MITINMIKHIWNVMNMVPFYTSISKIQLVLMQLSTTSGIILCMPPANERQHYNVMLSLIGCVHTQHEPCNITDNTLRLRHNRLHFASAVFQNEFSWMRMLEFLLTHCGLVMSLGNIDLGSTLAQVMACCLTAPSHYLNQCWLYNQ